MSDQVRALLGSFSLRNLHAEGWKFIAQHVYNPNLAPCEKNTNLNSFCSQHLTPLWNFLVTLLSSDDPDTKELYNINISIEFFSRF